MPIYEIKRPEPPLRPENADRESSLSVDGVRPVIRIRRYEGGRGKQKFGKRRRPETGWVKEKALRVSIDRANEELERHNVPIHLVLVAGEGGFFLEIYDRTDKQVCRAIRDLEIEAAELPSLLGKLQKEAGLMVDIIS